VTASDAQTTHFMSFRTSLRELLVRPSVSTWVPLLGVLFASSAIGRHYVLDDYVLGLMSRRDSMAGLVRGRWDLFAFTTGDPAMNRQLMEQGVMLPWWSDEELQIAFYRPLSSLLHHLDFVLWPDSPPAMYLHGLAWLGVVLALAAHLYRALESSPLLAGISALLFGLDDSHGAVVAWISNRNAAIATCFGLMTLLAHHDWRSRGRRASALLAPLAWLAALSAGEFAVGTLAYLISYTLFIERGPASRRVRALVPYALVLAAWSVPYARSGAGVQGSGSYVSPWLDFGRFASVAPLRLLGSLAATLGPIPSETLLFGRAEHFVYWAASIALLLAAAACALWPVLRRDRTARFWLGGMLLALVPISASFPSDRLLLFASVGGMGLLARIIAPLFEPTTWRSPRFGGAALPLFFGALHLLLAPLSLPLRAAQMQVFGRTLELATKSLDQLPELERRTVVILNAPLDALASYIQAERAFRRVPRPERLYWLTTAGSSLRVSRTDSHTLLVERSDGFLSTPLERHYRARPGTLARGHQVRLGPLLATVTSVTADARPLAVSFRFAERLESDSYVFLIWNDGRYQPLALDRLAKPLQLPAEDLVRILTRTALGAP
jgi:hypothetical protein